MANIRTETIAPFSFMGLMAGEGLIPGTASASVQKEVTSVAIQESINELASDMKANDTFFTLMEEAGQMSKIERVRKSYSFKIVRPVGLGGAQTAFAH
ncbi:hypothetical protein [Kordiimonas sp. SCSIO 12610]|uniref:hypothetical protein n=1 Tax=Kordiimonas sp. SCSIO 12610 TaxID=2829597 RepID=UPI00210A45B2|nr:hypothetical protein [Kordiimonas sp. SCSIO 12610]UTW54442.1 hypothetical protein KFF44_11560 [Kordiimonas sp. SCSIO 12610]